MWKLRLCCVGCIWFSKSRIPKKNSEKKDWIEKLCKFEIIVGYENSISLTKKLL